MLRSIVESKLSSNFTLLIDDENTSGGDLFRAFLIHSIQNAPEPVHLICLENPTKFFENISVKTKNKVITHDFFSDPCGWNGSSPSDLTSLLTNSDELSDSILLLDSINQLIVRLGFVNTYKILHKLKSKIKNIIILVHLDIINNHELENLLSLANTCIHLRRSWDEKSCHETAQVIYRKPNGKITSQTETFTIDDSYRVTSQIKGINREKLKTGGSTVLINDFDNLTTFELGLKMRENEKKAKEQLVLPYLRTAQKQTNDEGPERGGEGGGIIYNLEAVDLEDDPDDDLDI